MADDCLLAQVEGFRRDMGRLIQSMTEQQTKVIDLLQEAVFLLRREPDESRDARLRASGERSNAMVSFSSPLPSWPKQGIQESLTQIHSLKSSLFNSQIAKDAHVGFKR